METNFPYKKEFLPGSDLIICTNDEYNDLVWWWEQYCEDANNRRICDNGDDYTDYPENEPIFVLIWEWERRLRNKNGWLVYNRAQKKIKKHQTRALVH